MKKQMIAAAAVTAMAMLAGCGGGSSSGTTAAKVTGAVADGYLENATVFMDKNNNYRLDAGEPQTQTDANGAYTLTVDPADVGKYPIIALAVKGVTIDHDNGNTTPMTYSYMLSLPKESVSGTVSTDSNFISPLTTQVREMMQARNLTMTQAMDQLRDQMHLSAQTNVMGNYMGLQSQDADAMHTTAQNMATLMGGQMNLVYQSGSTTTTPTIDMNRYHGMMGVMFSNISSVQAATGTNQTMTQLMNQMFSDLTNITVGQPFQNMSSYYGGMMSGGGMMN